MHWVTNKKTGHVTSSSTWPFDFGTKPVSPAVFEILASKSIGVETLTFQGHVMSSVTWRLDSQVAISYRHYIVTKSLFPAISEIMGTKHIGVMTLTFQGHLTSSVTWPFDSHGPISYRHSIVTKWLSPAIFEIMAVKHWGHDLDLSGSRDVIGHVTIRFPGAHFL